MQNNVSIQYSMALKEFWKTEVRDALYSTVIMVVICVDRNPAKSSE